MFGVYIHIPFCRKACTYCNFHFSTQLHSINPLITSISREIELTPLPELGIQTLYFGGGTPSLLNEAQLHSIFSALRNKTDVNSLKEVTLECNPEDINETNLNIWASLGVNRLSIGLQSLNDAELEAMNRAHSAQQSFAALELLENDGRFLISVDLIYGTPWKSNDQWKQELETILSKSFIQHVSAYALTVESKTLLNHQINKGILAPVNDDITISQFRILQEFIHDFSWEDYEISNYCRSGFRALHNSNYWKFKPYYGFGPSAHSFDGRQLRYMNVAQNSKYVSSLESGILPRTYENLDPSSLLNERIMTGLRTKEGVNIATLLQFHPLWLKENQSSIQNFVNGGFIFQEGAFLKLTLEGKLISDAIISDLMWVP